MVDVARRRPTPGGLGRMLLRVVLFLALGGVLWAVLVSVLVGLVGTEQPAPLFASSAGMLAAAVIAGAVLLRWLDRRPASEGGFPLERRAVPETGRGLAIGVLMLALVLVPAAALGWVRYAPEPGGVGGVAGAWLFGLVVLAIPAAAEEALFRGYAFRAIADGAGPATAVAVTSVLFGLAHADNPAADPLALLNIVLAGVLLAVAVLRTGSLWLASALHLGWNWAVGSLAELPVSGLTFLETPAYEAVLRGAEWYTGGAFGPEGGLAGTLGFGAGIALVLRLVPARPRAAVEGAGAGSDVVHSNGIANG